MGMGREADEASDASTEAGRLVGGHRALERQLDRLEAAMVAHRREAVQEVQRRLDAVRRTEEGRREAEEAHAALWEAGREEREWVEAMWRQEAALHLQLMAEQEGATRAGERLREEQERKLATARTEQLREEWRTRREAQQQALAQRLRAVEQQASRRLAAVDRAQQVQRQELEDQCQWGTYKALVKRRAEHSSRLRMAEVNSKQQQRAAAAGRALRQER
eukprot:EG_transcript_28219